MQRMDFSALSSLEAGIIRQPVAGLPRGWIREQIPRYHANSTSAYGNGFANGKLTYDVVYYSPKGVKVKSKPELARALGEQYDVTAFDFQTGKINPLLVRTSAKPGPSAHGGGGSAGRKSSKPVSTSAGLAAAAAASNGMAGPGVSRTPETVLVPPIRQTASIFKQPVTVKKNIRDDEPEITEKKPELKATSSERPRQVFWEKRLAGLAASYPDEAYEPFRLPQNFLPVGPGVRSDAVLASLSSSLHLAGGAISGQKDSKSMTDVDATAFCQPDQPLIAATKVSQDDVDVQEKRVIKTRQRLAEAIQALEA